MTTAPPPLSFFKAHAYGNDFLCAPISDTRAPERAALARRLCHRHTGIGADGLILYAPTADGASMTLYNADGGVAEVSGNGVRCLAAWLASRHRLEPGAALVVGTAAGPKRLTLLEAAPPRYRFRADMGSVEGLTRTTVEVGGATVPVVTLSVGNPQCIVMLPTFDEVERRFPELGPGLATHPRFPEGTNVELAAVERTDRIRILIWERGVGPTSASGTGACAAAVAAAHCGAVAGDVDVVSPGGTQQVSWSGARTMRDGGAAADGGTVWLSGWAEILADGRWLSDHRDARVPGS